MGPGGHGGLVGLPEALSGAPLLVTSASVGGSYFLLVDVFGLSMALIQSLYGATSLGGASSVGMWDPQSVCGAFSMTYLDSQSVGPSV